MIRYSLLLISILLGTHAISQHPVNTQVTALLQKEQTFEITITSDKKYYVGGNIHVLTIGDKKFKYSKLDSTGKSITFIIPNSDFQSLVTGTEMWMSYGDKSKSTQITNANIKTLCEASPGTLWYLGKFDKSILKK
jgi:hypothetical protein